MFTLNFWLWAAQILLTVLFGFAGLLKTLRTKDWLDEHMHWAEDYSGAFVKFVGVMEILGAIGMILPLATGILPALTPLAAIGFVIVQVLGIAVHARRGETRRTLPANIVLLALSLFVLWGRLALL